MSGQKGGCSLPDDRVGTDVELCDGLHARGLHTLMLSSLPWCFFDGSFGVYHSSSDRLPILDEDDVNCFFLQDLNRASWLSGGVTAMTSQRYKGVLKVWCKLIRQPCSGRG